MDVSWGADCPALVCDPRPTGVIRAALETAFSGEGVVDAGASTASDDVARFLQAVPGCYIRVGATDLTAGPAIPHHHQLFDLDERGWLSERKRWSAP
ncbi:MAG TPA: hypothetical protein VF071_06030, partial [Candidatus Limnocylindria bacterium]